MSRQVNRHVASFREVAPVGMHDYDESTGELARSVFEYALDRIRMEPPMDGPVGADQLAEAVGQTITEEGLGGTAALATFTDHLAPACISVDHPRYMAWVPCAPTDTAVLFDLIVGASALSATWWFDGSGAIYAENQALKWISDLAGMPEQAGGCFVPGGTMGNLSALVAARDAAIRRRGGPEARPVRWAVVASEGAHASVSSAARVMDVDVLFAPTDSDRRLRGGAVADAVAARPEGTEVFAVVATSGTTNLGTVDALDEIASVAAANSLWFHVDGAYGGAGLAAASVRYMFNGIEHCDSLIVDPHKWLFAPYDCAALVYRDPAGARLAHTQQAGYLDSINERSDWNPSDYAHHLSRRPRGLPFWFSLAVHGTRAYSEAVEKTLAVTRAGAALIESTPHLELVTKPTLSILAFYRNGWTVEEYAAWSDSLLAEGSALVMPTTVDGVPALRLCIVNPRTGIGDIAAIVESLA